MSENTNSDKHVYGAGISGQTNQGRTIIMGQGNYNEHIDGNYIQGNYYAAREKQNLAEAAAEIQQLLEQLSKSYPSDTMTGKMTIATETIKTIENSPKLMEKIISALKAGGISALEQALNHPAASFVIGALENWQRTKNQ
jgi:phosphoenolpyruvate-protein kinase (PTS system EI component)